MSGWRVKLNPPLASNDNVRVPVRVAFTPDGADVFFLQQARGHLPRLLLAPMDGHSVARQLALGAGSPLVSADGSWAVYPAGNMLFSVRVDGSQGPLQLNQPLVSGALSSSVRDTLISPDGRWVLYTADERTLGTRELFARPLDASQPTCALNGPLVANGNVWWFQVTAQADRVVYGADQELDEVFELYSSALPALP